MKGISNWSNTSLPLSTTKLSLPSISIFIRAPRTPRARNIGSNSSNLMVLTMYGSFIALRWLDWLPPTVKAWPPIFFASLVKRKNWPDCRKIAFWMRTTRFSTFASWTARWIRSRLGAKQSIPRTKRPREATYIVYVPMFAPMSMKSKWGWRRSSWRMRTTPSSSQIDVDPRNELLTKTSLLFSCKQMCVLIWLRSVFVFIHDRFAFAGAVKLTIWTFDGASTGGDVLVHGTIDR